MSIALEINLLRAAERAINRPTEQRLRILLLRIESLAPPRNVAIRADEERTARLDLPLGSPAAAPVNDEAIAMGSGIRHLVFGCDRHDPHQGT